MLAAAKAEVVAGRVTIDSSPLAFTVATRTLGTRSRSWAAVAATASCRVV